MQYLIIVLVSVLPGLGWLWFFYRTDKYEPEPKKLVLRTFLLGVMVAIAFGTSFEGLPFPWGPARYAAVIWAPVLEELAKFLIVFWTVFANKNFNEPMDGIVYAASAALGFAACENAFYVLSSWHGGSQELGLLTLLARSVFSVPGHALFSSFFGAALGYSKGKKGLKPIFAVAGGLLLSMIAHGLFNWLSMENILGGLS
ncbi:MAG: PrsW family intramembrane metalloprotease, partial [bacterium]|nr:PrsW family intramembrane metalloprotease [bacterium]